MFTTSRMIGPSYVTEPRTRICTLSFDVIDNSFDYLEVVMFAKIQFDPRGRMWDRLPQPDFPKEEVATSYALEILAQINSRFFEFCDRIVNAEKVQRFPFVVVDSLEHDESVLSTTALYKNPSIDYKSFPDYLCSQFEALSDQAMSFVRVPPEEEETTHEPLRGQYGTQVHVIWNPPSARNSSIPPQVVPFFFMRNKFLREEEQPVLEF